MAPQRSESEHYVLARSLSLGWTEGPTRKCAQSAGSTRLVP